MVSTVEINFQRHVLQIDMSDPNDRRRSQYEMSATLDEIERVRVPVQLLKDVNVDI